MCLNVDFKWLCDVTTKDLCHSFTCWELCVVLLIDGRRSFTVILFACVVYESTLFIEYCLTM